jgi:hypothetical protein
MPLGVMEQWSIGVMVKQTVHNLQALIQHSITPILQLVIYPALTKNGS